MPSVLPLLLHELWRSLRASGRRASSQPSMRTYHIFFVGTPFMASAVLCERPRLARMARSSLRGFAARVRPQQRPKWELAGAREDANE